jgi:hypothetical protein
MASKVRTFTSTGKSVNGTRRAGVPTSPLGRLDPTTGKVWQKPRTRLNELVGSRVKVSNPSAASLNGMTGSMGMGGVGQRGRTRDVGSTKAKGES